MLLPVISGFVNVSLGGVSAADLAGGTLPAAFTTLSASGNATVTGTQVTVGPAGDGRSYFNNSFGWTLGSGLKLAWSSDPDAAAAGGDLFLLRAAPNTLAQRNGANAQTHFWYNTWTDNSNFERLVATCQGSVLYIYSEAAGTGVTRPLWIGTTGAASLVLGSNNSGRWEINSSGHLLAAGAYNITTTGNLSGSNLILSAAGAIYFGANGGTAYSYIYNNGDGILQLGDHLGAGNPVLQFGGTTSSFSALKRSGATIQVRLADDSGPAAITATNIPVADTGWTANADAGDKTKVIPIASSIVTIAAALDLAVSGAGTLLLAVAEKCKSLETAGVAIKLPNA